MISVAAVSNLTNLTAFEWTIQNFHIFIFFF